MRYAITGIGLAGLILVGGIVSATETPSIEYGKKLFYQENLSGSSSHRSCHSCHPDGKGLERAGDNPDVVKTTNGCIIGPVMGCRLDKDSMDMQSLVLFIQSLKKPQQQAIRAATSDDQ